MVIYLEEAVERKRAERGGALTRTSLREAVMEGALLRLRPKVMTVSTVVAGLLPIMWSTRVGAEVMKPLATPVLGGMVSSLMHVLIVTPVIFYSLRTRHLPMETVDQAVVETSLAGVAHARARRFRYVALSLVALALIVVAIGWTLSRGAGQRTLPAQGTTIAAIQRVRSGDLEIVLTSPMGHLAQGRSAFVIEFRSVSTHQPVDVGTVRASGAMRMPGMVMSGGIETTPSGTGRYNAVGEFGMAGTWQMTIEWQGPAGNGSVSFEGTVQ